MKSIYEFGAALLDAGDLDPAYSVIYHAGFQPGYLRRLLLGYWCFYDIGTAAKVADSSDFWWQLDAAARSPGNTFYPRGMERRHFRGKNAIDSVAWLRSVGVDSLFAPLEGKVIRLAEVMEYVGSWKGFGPWISFKAADMVERLGLSTVIFEDVERYLYESPRQAAFMMFADTGVPSVDTATTDGVLRWALNAIPVGPGLYGRKAPPDHARSLGDQEAETILCKWKAYRSGHYRVGEDVRSLRASLLRASRSDAVQRMLRAGKKEKLWH